MPSHNRRPAILVIGATGAQGGSVARHLLADGRWTVRAFVRNPESSAAHVLRDAGVEIAVGDLEFPERLRDAMATCHGVFGLTSAREPWGRRLRHARAIVDAAAAARVPHLVLRTRAEHHHTVEGQLAVSPWELEAAIVQYAQSRSVPATFVRVALQYEQLHERLGTYHRRHDARVAAVASDDVGGVVAALFARRDEFLGRSLGIVGDERRPHDYADAVARALGRRVSPAAGTRFDERTLDDHAEIDECRRLFPRLRTLEAWARAHALELMRAPSTPETTVDAAA